MVKNPIRLLIAISVCELVGILSIPFTINSIPTWYISLQKPLFSPPNWIFGPVWTTLYLMMGVSAYLIWQKGIQKKGVKDALKIFSVQLFLNFLWSIVFFGFHSPTLACIEIIFLWIFIFLSILKFYKISKIAAYLLLPYLLWVSFASVLNLFIVMLNR